MQRAAAIIGSAIFLARLMLAEPPLHRWAYGTEVGERLCIALIDSVWRAAAEAFGLGLEPRAMKLLTDGMWGRPMFGSWTSERIDAVMRNAAAMQALTQSRDAFPDMQRSAVACLRMPTLLLHGEHTSAPHRQVMNELSRVMSHSNPAEIPFAGHGSPNENPDGFNAAVGQFLDSQGRAAGGPQ